MPGQDDSISAAVTGEWVELRELGSADRLVLKSSEADIPPARGRRTLTLAAGRLARAGAPGPTDRLESAGGGHWDVAGNRLRIDLPGWSGTYSVEKTDAETIVLKRE
jgi:hypothetical protein